MRISQIQISLVMSDYKIMQNLNPFRGPHTKIFTLQSKFYICACTLTVFIPKTSIQILQGNS